MSRAAPAGPSGTGSQDGRIAPRREPVPVRGRSPCPPRRGSALARFLRASARPRRGFTLVEMLVALAIGAVALAAGMRVLAQSSDGAGALKARTLALWVAQNRLAAAELAAEAPAPGERSGEATQAGVAFVWRERTSGTPNPAFRRLDIEVAARERPDHVLASLTGYLARGGPR